ncbi:MAG: hypothetical protein J0M04_17795 [Verrucomicrobia bacterium]|nr:hypothetical protein [Verrucomicrobiota bacterium]
MKHKGRRWIRIAGIALCLAAAGIWWVTVFRSGAPKPHGPTEVELRDINSLSTPDVPIRGMPKESQAQYARIVQGDVWPENFGNLVGFFRYLLDRDPALAVRFYDLAPGECEKSNAADAIAGEWFRKDPSAAIHWIVSDSRWKDNDRPRVRGAIANAIRSLNYNQHDVSEVLDAISLWASSEPDLKEKKDIDLMKDSVLTAFGTQSEIAVIEDRMKRMGLDDKIHLALAGRAEKEPAEILQYYENRREIMPDRVAVGLVRGRLDEHPDLALEYLASHPWGVRGMSNEPSIDVGYLAKDVMNRYLDVDSIDASTRLSQMEAGRPKDYCIKAMASWLAQRGSKAEILPWLPAIEDARVRETVEKLAR